MEDQVWSFSRNGEQLELRRERTEAGFMLAVHGDGPSRNYAFDDEERMEQFQADFEKFLLGTGWMFLGFCPERRGGRERRHFSRLLTDRRRWWTDGVATPPEREEQERQRRVKRPSRS